MKIEKYISIISILIITYLVIKKIIFDIEMLQVISLEDKNQSSFRVIKVPVYYFGVVILSIFLSVIGFIKKIIFRKLGLFLNFFGLIYLMVPYYRFLN